MMLSLIVGPFNRFIERNESHNQEASIARIDIQCSTEDHIIIHSIVGFFCVRGIQRAQHFNCLILSFNIGNAFNWANVENKVIKCGERARTKSQASNIHRMHPITSRTNAILSVVWTISSDLHFKCSLSFAVANKSLHNAFHCFWTLALPDYAYRNSFCSTFKCMHTLNGIYLRCTYFANNMVVLIVRYLLPKNAMRCSYIIGTHP